MQTAPSPAALPRQFASGVCWAMAPPSGIAQPAWSIRLLAELADVDRRARAVMNGLSLEQLNWNPGPNSWSIGQCLHHLLLANEVYLPPIAAALHGRPRSPVQYIYPGWFSRWFMRNYIEPQTRKKRAKAPAKIVPPSRIDGSILDSFLRSNEGARELVLGASEHDVNRIRFKNPFVPLIRFTVGTGLEIVSRHQVRHLMQAERVSAASQFLK